MSSTCTRPSALATGDTAHRVQPRVAAAIASLSMSVGATATARRRDHGERDTESGGCAERVARRPPAPLPPQRAADTRLSPACHAPPEAHTSAVYDRDEFSPQLAAACGGHGHGDEETASGHCDASMTSSGGGGGKAPVSPSTAAGGDESRAVSQLAGDVRRVRTAIAVAQHVRDVAAKANAELMVHQAQRQQRRRIIITTEALIAAADAASHCAAGDESPLRRMQLQVQSAKRDADAANMQLAHLAAKLDHIKLQINAINDEIQCVMRMRGHTGAH